MKRNHSAAMPGKGFLLTGTRHLSGLGRAFASLAIWAFALPAIYAQTAPFPQCPAIGASASCRILLVVDSNTNVHLLTDPNAGATYDEDDDTLVGILNHSGNPISSLRLRGTDVIFGFDRDGICTFSGGPPCGPSGYEGPGVAFSNISNDRTSGTVVFDPPIAAGDSRYFGLENAAIIFGSADTGLTTPPGLSTLGIAGTPSNPTASIAEPVNTATGNFYMILPDLSVPGKIPFTFVRSYNSQLGYDGPMGLGWNHSLNIHLFLLDKATGIIGILQADGNVYIYKPTGGGSYAPVVPGLFHKIVQNSDQSYTMTLKNQTVLSFGSNGSLSTITDRNGNTQTLTYDSGAHLTAVNDSAGRAFLFAYTPDGRLSTLTDPLGRSLHYAYDSHGNLISYTDASGAATQYTYAQDSLLESVVDPRGNVSLYNQYDSNLNLIYQTDAMSNTTQFAYNYPAAGVTTVVDPLGNQTLHVYDAGLRLIGIVDGANDVTSYGYGADGLRNSVTDGNGHYSSYSYDSSGNLSTFTDPLGNQTSYTYNVSNQITSITGPRQRQTRFSYDAKGNLLSTIDPDGGTTTNTYNGSGLLLSTQNTLGYTTNFQYDMNGNPAGTTDANGVWKAANDAGGRQLAVTNPLGKTWKRTFDPLNRPLTTADPLGNQAIFKYDANGNRIAVTDANGNTTSFTYDSSNNLTKVLDALGNATVYQYDANNQLIQLTDPKGNATYFEYDAGRRLSTRTDALGNALVYQYDLAGNLAATTDGNGNTNHFAYDPLNRIRAIDSFDGKSVAYKYDEFGNRTGMADPHGNTTYTFDSLNRVTAITNPDGGATQFSYDAAGNRTSSVYPDGKTVQYRYDNLDHLSQVVDWSSRPTIYTRDAAGRLIGSVYPNGSTTGYTYDDANRLAGVVNQAGAKLLSSFQYDFDAAGNRTRVTSAKDGVSTYTYDKLNQLTSWTSGAGTAIYKYDAAGNRTSITTPAGTISFTYDEANQLLTGNNKRYTYSTNGSLTSITLGSTTQTYGWDALNRLVSAKGGGASAQYQYDGDGERISRMAQNGAYSYTFDTARPLPLVLTENGSEGNFSFSYGDGLLRATSSTADLFYSTDGSNNVTGITDGSGAGLADYKYDPWGTATANGDQVGAKNKVGFNGEQMDADTGLVYMGARYYSPELGRFISRDPLGFGGGQVNLYEYVGNNPLNLSDPSGLSNGASRTDDYHTFFSTVNTLSSSALKVIPKGNSIRGPLRFLDVDSAIGSIYTNMVSDCSNSRSATTRFLDALSKSFDIAANVLPKGPAPVVSAGSLLLEGLAWADAHPDNVLDNGAVAWLFAKFGLDYRASPKLQTLAPAMSFQEWQRTYR